MKIRSFDDFFSSRWTLRIISLVIAIFLWFFVAWDRSGEASRQVRIPVVYVNLPEGLVLTKQATSVNAKIVGNVAALSALDHGDLIAEVDLKGLSEGTHLVPVKVVLPGGLTLASVDPSRVSVTLTRHAERMVPVVAQVVGEIPPGVKLNGVKIEPEMVSLRGPQDLLAKVKSVRVFLRSADLIDQSEVVLPVSIDIEGVSSADLFVWPKEVTLRPSVSQPSEGVVVSIDVPIRGVPDPDYVIQSVSITPKTVRVTGPTELLSHLKTIRTEPVDVNGITDDLSLVLPLIPPAPGISILDDQTTVRVDIFLRRRVQERVLENIPVQVEGHGSFKSWRVDPPVVAVVVEVPTGEEGPPVFPIEAYVDVTNVVSQRIMLPVLVRSEKKDLRVLRVDPPQVMVRAVTP